MILCKVFDSIEEVNKCFEKSCSQVSDVMCDIVENNEFKSYNDYAKWAINTCSEALPTPFAIEFPACFSLSIGPTYFNIRFPNAFGLGIRVNLGRKNISYEVTITFFNSDTLVAESDYYREMIDNEWKVKEFKHK